MESKKMKKLLLSCGLVGVVGVGASLAYFSDVTDILRNTFSIFGSGAGEQAIELNVKEKEAVLQENTHNYVAGSEWIYDSVTGDANDYENLIPGSTVYKNPTVEVKANTIESVVVVRVENLYQSAYSITGFGIGEADNQWTVLNNYEDPDTANVTFLKYNSNVDTTDGTDDDLTALFTGLTFNSNIDENTPVQPIVVSAAAVQVENNPDALTQAVTELGGQLKQ